MYKMAKKEAKHEAKMRKKYAGRDELRSFEGQEIPSQQWRHVRPLEVIDPDG